MLKRRALLFALMCGLTSTSACTVKPLYADRDGAGFENNVAVAPVQSRVAQQVRNRLLFLLNGSGAVATNPEYEASLNINSNAQSVLSASNEDTADGSNISARRVRVSGVLTIRESRTQEVRATFNRSKFASFDNSSQAFANSRALVDAENRAAQELAEEFRNLIVSYTSNR